MIDERMIGGRVAMPLVIERARSVPDHVRNWQPRSDLGRAIAEVAPHLAHVPELRDELIERIASSGVIEATLRATVRRKYGLFRAGLIGPEEAAAGIEELGIVSRRVVTTVGVGYIVDAFQNTVELENMKFHGLGTGSTAEAAGDTALVTELTTEYTGNVRATGTTTEFAANIYQTVATNTLDSGTPNLREHGVFSASAAGVLLDRSVFAGIALDGTVGDALTTDYRLTFTAGG